MPGWMRRSCPCSARRWRRRAFARSWPARTRGTVAILHVTSSDRPAMSQFYTQLGRFVAIYRIETLFAASPHSERQYPAPSAGGPVRIEQRFLDDCVRVFLEHLGVALQIIV